MLETRLTELLGCKYPIVQTAMGWVADPNLVAGSCNAGGFGFLAGATIPADEMERDIGGHEHYRDSGQKRHVIAW